MPPNDAVRPEDDLDHALGDVLEYLGLSAMVDRELNVMGSPMNKVIVALLASQELHGELSPYRQHLLERIRSVEVGVPGARR